VGELRPVGAEFVHRAARPTASPLQTGESGITGITTELGGSGWTAQPPISLSPETEEWSAEPVDRYATSRVRLLSS
jgi:hypothetical protein